MKVIICGAGRVGYGIAKELADERNSVTMVDLSPELIEQASINLDVRGVVGHGSHPDVLARAGAADADLIVAVTQSDEVNMVACQIAHSLFNTPMRIARVRAQTYLEGKWEGLFSRKHLPIDITISPELEVGKAILRRLEQPGAFDSFSFADDAVHVVGVRLKPGCPVLATPLVEIYELFSHLQFKIGGLRREDRLFVPTDVDQLLDGDEVYLFCEKADVDRVVGIFGDTGDRARKVVIIGGGNIGVSVAAELEHRQGMRVRVVEADKRRAEDAAAQLGRTVVLHGDGLAPAILDEAGVPDAEIVMCLTNDDKVNVLASALAKRQGARRAICLVNEGVYHELKGPLGVDVFVDPRATTVSTVLQHVRRGRITGLQFIGDGAAEIIEGEVLDTSPLVGKSVTTSKLSDGVCVGAVVRGDEVLINDADRSIEVGDRLVLFVERAEVPRVEKLFRVALEYF